MNTEAPRGWLDGSVALVTGGAHGIGAAVVARYVAEGARVCILDRDEAAARSLAENYPDAAIAVGGDVTSYKDNAAAVAAAVAAFGGLDVFIGNAGVFDFNRPLGKFDVDRLGAAFDEIFAVNVKGYLFGAKAALEAVRASRGAMIFTVSNAGLYAGGGGPLYVASKHAVVGLIRQLAFELAPDVRVNGVAPGGTLTRLSGLAATGQDGLHLDEVDGAADHIARGTPLGFAPAAEDHAGAYVLLGSSSNARAITGAILPSDGGLEVRGGGRRKSKAS
jgi:NAD(P)-dependent dehydrogenase (short-subunit alcohol dehydrogenase family)